MPLKLIADRPGHAVLQSYDEPALQPDQICVRSLFSSVKHGTEGRGFLRNTLDASDRWDWEMRLHIHGEASGNPFPLPLGNMSYGIVTETGDGTTRFQVGDFVFGHLPIQETHTLPENRVEAAPQGVSPQGLMYWDPADFAVGGVRDGGVRLGDRVAVFGLGAIGQMALQCARVAGARWVVAVDPIARRRDAAIRHGADLALDPTEVDAGLEIKRCTDKLGVDVAMETSGSSRALNDALRATRYQGALVSTAYYAEPAHGLHLAGEWHRNRVRIVSSRANSEPLPDYGWDFHRIRSESLALIVQGKLKADDLIDPIVPLQQAAETYQEVYEHPELSIKLGVDHTAGG